MLLALMLLSFSSGPSDSYMGYAFSEVLIPDVRWEFDDNGNHRMNLSFPIHFKLLETEERMFILEAFIEPQIVLIDDGLGRFAAGTRGSWYAIDQFLGEKKNNDVERITDDVHLELITDVGVVADEIDLGMITGGGVGLASGYYKRQLGRPDPGYSVAAIYRRTWTMKPQTPHRNDLSLDVRFYW